jgi:hypothetical protein
MRFFTRRNGGLVGRQIVAVPTDQITADGEAKDGQ